MPRTYSGKKSPAEGGPGEVLVREEDGSERVLDPGPSQRIRNHSPDGFQWGYGGSGPAQLALALLLDLGIAGWAAEAIYQRFKFEVVAGLPPVWEKTEAELREVAGRLLKEREK